MTGSGPQVAIWHEHDVFAAAATAARMVGVEEQVSRNRVLLLRDTTAVGVAAAPTAPSFFFLLLLFVFVLGVCVC